MNEEKIVNNYYQSNIKTSRNEDSVYAMRYASQQMLINKLEHNWNELKSWLEEEYTKWENWYNNDLDTHDRNYYREEYLCTKNNIACFQIKMQELEEGGNNE